MNPDWNSSSKSWTWSWKLLSLTNFQNSSLIDGDSLISGCSQLFPTKCFTDLVQLLSPAPGWDRKPQHRPQLRISSHWERTRSGMLQHFSKVSMLVGTQLVKRMRTLQVLLRVPKKSRMFFQVHHVVHQHSQLIYIYICNCKTIFREEKGLNVMFGRGARVVPPGQPWRRVPIQTSLQALHVTT